MSKRMMRPRPVHYVDAVSVPRGDVFPPPLRMLQVQATTVVDGVIPPSWVFLAAHGGSGAALLARLSQQSAEQAITDTPVVGDDGDEGPLPGYGVSVGRRWPNPELEPVPPVIIVCQSTMRGLAWARDIAAQYLSAQAPPGVRVHGVVTIADQPGRPPKPIEAARNLLEGAYPVTWQIPYVPQYRLLTGLPQEDPPPIHPGVETVLAAIRAAIPPKGPLS